jgi:hypothetical protein
MNFIQRPRGGRPGHEFPDAITERTVDNQIGSSVFNPTFVVERRPFAKDSRRAKIDIRVVTAVHLDFAFSPSSREPNVAGFRLAIAQDGSGGKPIVKKATPSGSKCVSRRRLLLGP